MSRLTNFKDDILPVGTIKTVIAPNTPDSVEIGDNGIWVVANLWPMQLTARILLVLSVLDGSDQQKQLATLYPKAATLQVEPLGQKACSDLLMHLLAPRTLTREQQQTLTAHHNGIPLAVVLTEIGRAHV